ncbi:hypothetical protein BJV82DRAFT_507259 [Fennellomyces sp. T-0311]|nr:hypothetical protein BJV82DRAFT_507259 [Fennellomyces sp. T-0311]
MRRRKDSYVNSTQILKAAGFDKGKRTRIVEREILPGVHEKVQGGYGKFQGTWIPVEIGIELADRYGVYELVRPLFEMDPSQYDDDDSKLPTKEEALAHYDPPHTASPPPSPLSSASPLSLASPHPKRPIEDRPRKKIKVADEEKHRSLLMGLFISPDDSPQVVELLKPPDIDINLVIDDQGNTALHWAASLARIKTLELLINRGADATRVNYAGETALMRGVMMTHCFDSHCFPALLDHLKESIPIMDRRRRTVIHHAALTASEHGRYDAAMFYMKHILNAVVSARHIQSVIHVEDVKGDTGLSIAMRHGLDTMVTMLNEFSSITRKAAESKQPLDTPIPDIPKKVYASNPRGREIVSTVQKLMDEIDEDHASQLRERDQQLERTQTQLQTVMLELSEARRKLAMQQTKGQKLAESYELMRKLEDALDYNTNSQTDPDREPQARERWLEERVQILEAQAEAHGQIREELANQIEDLKAHSSEKEMQCKRLIAACCNMSVDEIDEILELLLASVESNPPDLDLPQVIQYVERLRHDEANNKGS